jgi:hypothetical protein
MKNSVEYILWKDCVSIDAWTDIDELVGELHQIETIGQFIKETEETVVLALNIDRTEGHASCVINIPKVNIVTRKQLKLISE